MATAGTPAAYEGLSYTVFQQLRRETSEGLVIAFTSANTGEGVTHTIEALLRELARDVNGRTLSADSRILRRLRTAPSELESICLPMQDQNQQSLFELRGPPANSPAVKQDESAWESTWESSWEYRRDVMSRLRELFQYVLIDCPALAKSNDILSLASFADGVILIVEADRTRREQIVNAERTIEFAQGRLLGHILNKRRYVIPDWIYRRL